MIHAESKLLGDSKFDLCILLLFYTTPPTSTRVLLVSSFQYQSDYSRLPYAKTKGKNEPLHALAKRINRTELLLNTHIFVYSVH